MVINNLMVWVMDVKKSEVTEFLKNVWSQPSIIIKTPDYLYALKKEGEKWVEVSYLFSDKEMQRRILQPEEALLYLIEELTKSLVHYSNSLKEHIIVENGKLNEILSSI